MNEIMKEYRIICDLVIETKQGEKYMENKLMDKIVEVAEHTNSYVGGIIRLEEIEK